MTLRRGISALALVGALSMSIDGRGGNDSRAAAASAVAAERAGLQPSPTVGVQGGFAVLFAAPQPEAQIGATDGFFTRVVLSSRRAPEKTRASVVEPARASPVAAR
jgi:hypothetical protein